MFTGGSSLTSLLGTIIDSIYFVDETCKCSDLILCNDGMQKLQQSVFPAEQGPNGIYCSWIGVLKVHC